MNTIQPDLTACRLLLTHTDMPQRYELYIQFRGLLTQGVVAFSCFLTFQKARSPFYERSNIISKILYNHSMAAMYLYEQLLTKRTLFM